MKGNESHYHVTVLGRVLWEAMNHPETQGCDCILCKKRGELNDREKARLLGVPPVV